MAEHLTPAIHDPNAPTYDNVVLRKEGNTLVIDVDGQVSSLPGGSVNAYFADDGRVVVSIYAYLYAHQVNLVGDDGMES